MIIDHEAGIDDLDHHLSEVGKLPFRSVVFLLFGILCRQNKPHTRCIYVYINICSCNVINVVVLACLPSPVLTCATRKGFLQKTVRVQSINALVRDAKSLAAAARDTLRNLDYISLVLLSIDASRRLVTYIEKPKTCFHTPPTLENRKPNSQ